jgi:hypothetical protein
VLKNDNVSNRVRKVSNSLNFYMRRKKDLCSPKCNHIHCVTYLKIRLSPDHKYESKRYSQKKKKKCVELYCHFNALALYLIFMSGLFFEFNFWLEDIKIIKNKDKLSFFFSRRHKIKEALSYLTLILTCSLYALFFCALMRDKTF